jgi:hypothetical protein
MFTSKTGGNSRNPISKSVGQTPTIVRSYRTGQSNSPECESRVGIGGEKYYLHSSAERYSVDGEPPEGNTADGKDGSIRIVRKEID